MFEPENDIERALVRASREPSERPAFVRALMDSQVFIVLTAEGGSIVPGPNGTATVSEGATLKIASAVHNDERLLAFFTSPVRAQAWFVQDHIVAPQTTRSLFLRAPDMPFVLNPGSDYGKEFTPEEVRQLLTGNFGDGSHAHFIPPGEQVLLAHPKEVPQALIAALGRELGALANVSGAWLMLAHQASQVDQSWMLGVESAGDWQVVRAAVERAVAGGVLKGRALDVAPMDDSSLTSTLRTGIPIVTAKRGFFSKLFR